MKHYHDFPPYPYFIRVLKNCPSSALLYIQIWKAKGKNSKIALERKDVRRQFLVSPTMLRNTLASLMYLNIVTFKEVGDRFQIDVLGIENDSE